MSDRVIYIIPAREGSKGFPHKNRELIHYTTQAIRGQWLSAYITTDDPEIIKIYENTLINVIQRPPELSGDLTPMKSVLMHAVDQIMPYDDALLVTLYPTYPQRRLSHIERAIEFFTENNAKSMLCQKEHKGVSPYLLMYPSGKYGGKQVIQHNYYRRQDYLPVFEISHFISIIHTSELPKVNNNLYNERTVFMPIGDIIDVDELKDFTKFKDEIRSNL